MFAALASTEVRPKIFTLQSRPVLFKFMGLPHALFSYLVPSWDGSDGKNWTFLSSPADYIRTLSAMTRHASQLVWFRYMYVLFSTYMYGGTFTEVNVS